jgi:hypothetical protein
MRWRKLGLVFAPDGSQPWARAYAHLPTAVAAEDGRIRVYFAGLDDRRVGRIGLVELDAADPTRVLVAHGTPVLDVGEPGTFDDCGVNPSAIVRAGDRVRLYYIGWQRTERVPYMLFAGVADSEDGGLSFRRRQRTPVLDRTPSEPFLRSATTVLEEDGRLRAWYVSGTGWGAGEAGQYPRYVVRHATSEDGITWSGGSAPCIDVAAEGEFGFGRPWVLRDGALYRMWYSIRSTAHPYRIGYAESPDGLRWERRDALAGIARSESGWDSEMVCYPSVIDVAGRRLMFYNGNRHGSTGFGVAVLDEA